MIPTLLHSVVDLDPAVFFAPATYPFTRGHPWKLAKPLATSRPRRNSFAARIINDWNALPYHVVSSATVNQFKARLDRHWTELQYAIPYQD